ncbi:MAG: ribonuclease P protein component [Chthoniobacterales bacterium]
MKRSELFRQVREAGSSQIGALFRLAVFKEPDAGVTQFGIITTRRMGTAVLRSRLRRKCRELLRRHQYEVVSGAQVVIIPRRCLAGASADELDAEWLRLGRRLALFRV